MVDISGVEIGLNYEDVRWWRFVNILVWSVVVVGLVYVMVIIVWVVD